MKHTLIAVSLSLLAGTASAAVPSFNAICPGGIEIHADEGGPVYFNGTEATLEVFNEDYYEASHDGVTLSITISPDKSLNLSYTASGGANGVCEVVN